MVDFWSERRRARKGEKVIDRVSDWGHFVANGNSVEFVLIECERWIGQHGKNEWLRYL